MRYSSGLIADQKRTAAALVRVSKMMGKVRLDGYRGCADGLNPRLLVKSTPCLHNIIRKHAMLSTEPQEKDSRCGMYHQAVSKAPPTFCVMPETHVIVTAAGHWAHSAGARDTA